MKAMNGATHALCEQGDLGMWCNPITEDVTTDEEKTGKEDKGAPKPVTPPTSGMPR